MVSLVIEGGIDGFHSEVETKDEVVEIETYAPTVTDGQLFQKVVDFEHPSRLFFVAAQSPDVSCVDKQSTVEFPKQMGAIFHVQVHLHVTGLIDEVDVAVPPDVFSRAETSYAPSSHAVRTAGEVAFFERKDIAVTVWIGNAEAEVQHECIVIVEPDVMGIVYIAFDILCKSDIEQFVHPQFIF